jgi:hypothetical protein
VVDVDDGLSISEPPPSEAFTALADALTASQAGRGGDRRVGRRLAGLLDSNGFEPAAVIVLPQAAYLTPAPGDPAAALMRQRLLAARPGIVSGGHMAADEFDRRLEEFAAETPVPRCEIEGHLAVVARRRA